MNFKFVYFKFVHNFQESTSSAKKASASASQGFKLSTSQAETTKSSAKSMERNLTRTPLLKVTVFSFLVES